MVFENEKKVLYTRVLRPIYGMLQAALIWYKTFRRDLEGEDFVFNPYDPCVANRVREGKQHTIRFHVDDVNSSHINPKVNDEFKDFLQKKYGEHGDAVVHRGTKHDYLGMKMDYNKKGKVVVDMQYYIQEMLDDFKDEVKEGQIAKTPAGDNLFNFGEGKKLDKSMAEKFHTTVAKGLFVAKRARPDIHPTIAVLCTRVREPNISDWNKLIRLMKYLNGTKEKVLTLSVDNLQSVKWFVDASYAVHPDYKSHSGAVMTMGSGAIQSISRKQKLNTRSSTEAELVAADDAATMICWTKLFLEEQGYKVGENILYQDNKSAILLEENGRKSAGKCSRALNVRYFFLTDQVELGNVNIVYCPTGEMVADFMTKPLQGEKFIEFREAVLGT